VSCSPGGVGAQTLQISAGEPSVTVGQSITVVEDGGRPLKARIADMAPERIVLEYQGKRREIPTTSVTRITRGDSLRNGAFVGFLIGGSFGLERLGNCQMNCYGVYVPILAGLGAGIGTLVDALKRQTTLYVTPDRTAATPVNR
jgi:hypothetical protein